MGSAGNVKERSFCRCWTEFVGYLFIGKRNSVTHVKGPTRPLSKHSWFLPKALVREGISGMNKFGKHSCAIVVAVVMSTMTVLSPVAVADPIPPEPIGGSSEDGSAPAVFVQEAGAQTDADEVPVEPLALVDGLAPDLDDLPDEWLQATPAEAIQPALARDLMPSVKDLGTDASTAAAAVPSPPTKSLPSTLDAAPGWQYSYSCDPNDKPGMVAFAKLISTHYNRPRYSTSRSCKAGNASQHGEGRAVDWSMDAFDADDKAIGDAVAYWLTTNNGEMARRFGVQSVVWNKRSWYLYSPGSWRTYTGPSPHTDHLHISFTWDGSMKRTSWWDGTPVTTVDHGTCRVYADQYAPRYDGWNTRSCSLNLPNPPSSPYPVTLPGASNATVATAQRYLGFTGSAVDGSFGPQTLVRLLDYQRSRSLPWTGVLDNATWAYMASAGVPTTNTSDVSRLAGPDRYGTAAAVAKQYPTGGWVYVTTGENYPDALSASAAAGTYDNPVLLTGQDFLPTATRNQLSRIDPWRIYLVGGESAVNSNVYRALTSYAGNGGVQRLSGPDRYGTAAEVSERFGSNVSVAYISTGLDFPDALVGAARAGRKDGPMLLTRSGSLPSETRSALRRLNPGRITIVGNRDSVSSAVARDLERYTDGTVYRVGGSSPLWVAVNLSSYYSRGLNVVYLATSADYPDALTGAALAGSTGGPVLYTYKNALPGNTKEALSDLDPDRIVILGGNNAVSDAVERQAQGFTD